MTKKTIVLFQQDLRLSDNPALTHAEQRGEVIPVYIFDTLPHPYAPGGASQWWLHHSLQALQADFARLGIRLILHKGETLATLRALLQETSADAVYWNRCYEPHAIEKGKHLKTMLEGTGIEAKSFAANLLFEPWEIATRQDQPFKVFTPFWKQCLAHADRIAQPLPVPSFSLPHSKAYASDALEDWKLLPTKPDWAAGLRERWQPGEQNAHHRLHDFLENALKDYPAQRDFPAENATSGLSPSLHFGEISPRQIWHAVRMQEARAGDIFQGASKFLSELGWREFSYHLLYHFPTLPDQPFNPKFRAFPWKEDASALRAWQQGKTGYPLVDAGMRELWHTGYMHNRVRMVVASFLTKHLRIHWKKGAEWFWDTLVDADLANNSASWQWVAGCGADASPYYRIFNPVLQGQKFDPQGNYIRRWIPELADLPDAYIHAPWEASAQQLQHAKIVLGVTYPAPMVDHATARNAALNAYKSL